MLRGGNAGVSLKEDISLGVRSDRLRFAGGRGGEGDDRGGVDDCVVAATLQVLPDIACEAKSNDDEQREGSSDRGGRGDVRDEGDDGDDEKVEVGQAAELVADGERE